MFSIWSTLPIRTTISLWELFVYSSLKLNGWWVTVLLLETLKYLSFVLCINIFLWLSFNVKWIRLIQVFQVLYLDLAIVIIIIWMLRNWRLCHYILLLPPIISRVCTFQIHNHFLLLLHIKCLCIKFFSLILDYLFHFSILFFKLKFNLLIFSNLLLTSVQFLF